MKRNHGLTLVELIIAMVLFATVMVAVLESSLSIQDTTKQHEDLIDLEREGRAILSQLTLDFSNSGWFPLGGGRFLPEASAFSSATFGNTVDFLRIGKGSTNDRAVFDLSAACTPMSEWKTPTTVIPGLVADELFLNNGPSRLVTPVWRPITDKATDPLSFADNSELANLALYRYQVMPNDGGRGSLWRYCRQGSTAPWTVDPEFQPLGRHIYELRITPVLNTQRLQISLELRKETPDKARAIRHFVTVVAMRSAY